MKIKSMSLQSPPRRKQRNPVMMKCPVCSKEGRIDQYHPRDTNKSTSRTEFVIVHEGLGYDWGTKPETKVQARRRCYIVKPTHRNQVIKRLGRLIA